ncbi:MAG: hypothetical protein L0Y73_03250 [Candidatus Aminicenantes bacterium]|nr:hypothetical protein [Candidatus Aminicenantes bacterium]
MKKKIVDTAIFFTILYWILTYIFVIKKGWIFEELTPVNIAIITGVNLAIILLARFLVPVFDGISKITKKIGTAIFAGITILIFIFILTPIALFKKLRGYKSLKYKFEKEKETYFDEWEPSPDIEKQY